MFDVVIPIVLYQIGGLQLEGCSFDGSRLTENSRDSPNVVAMPPCMVAWVTKDAPPPYPSSKCLSLPVYQSTWESGETGDMCGCAMWEWREGDLATEQSSTVSQ